MSSDVATPPAAFGDHATRALVDRLLESSFLLASPQGTISRWELPAARLFGWSASDAIGRPLLETLGVSEGLPEWRAVFERGEGPTPTARAEVTARHRDGREFRAELTFVPIPLSEGLDFNTFLHELRPERSRRDPLARVRDKHGLVLRSITGALAGDRDSEDERLAGLIVAFTPLEEAPWAADAPAVDELAPAAPGSADPLEEALRRAERATARADEAEADRRADAAEALAQLDEVRSLVAGLAAEVEQVRAEAADATSRAAAAERVAMEARSEATDAAGPVGGLTEELDTIRAELSRAREEAAHALDAAREAREVEERRREEAGARLRAIDARHPVGAAAGAGNGNGPAPKPLRPAREGFDDAGAAMAVIGLDGRFRELNPAFSTKVGYTEEEFREAQWPSLGDRANLEEHRGLMRAFRAGEIDDTAIDTTYMHKQGLLVPIGGRMFLVRDDGGEPLHLLFVDAD